MSKGLYIHVPFCVRKCSYCDFYSLAGAESRIEDYVSAVIRNIPRDISFDTVYLGGGTPSLLSGEQVKAILSAADIAAGAEISLECNPDSADFHKLCIYRQAGVNRLSFGVQSLADRELEAVKRLHSSAEAEKAILSAKKAGFENISADIMIGLPFQNENSLKESIDRLVSLGVTHISAYMLKIEEGTPISSQKELLKSCADEDTLAELYLMTASRLEQAGFEHYEISNFAKKGFECRHNLKYWRCEDYIGIGPAAHSCTDGKRFAVPADMDRFIAAKRQETYITDDSPCGREERLMLGLRLKEGFTLSLAGEKSGTLTAAAEPLEKHGLLKLSEGRICLTAKGFLVSNQIIALLAEALE